MPRFIARINVAVNAISDVQANDILTEVIGHPAIDTWDYVSSDGPTKFYPIPEPSLDDLFEAAVDNETV